MRLDIRTETFASPEDQSWLGSAHGTNEADSITLDGDMFLAAFPTGVVPSGVVLGRVTSNGLYGPYGASPSEVQTINLGAASAGTVTITFDGQTTGAIAFNASAATVQTALEAMSNINPGDVVVTGGPLPGTITLTFGGQYLGVNVPQVTVTPTGLTGGTVTVATTTEGGGVVNDGREVARGHLFTTIDLGGTTAAGVGNTPAALYWHGQVVESKLPAGHGLDAAAKGDLRQIRYV